MRFPRTLLLIACVAALACARHVVREPEAGARLNDPDWTVRSEPATSKGSRPAQHALSELARPQGATSASTPPATPAR